MILPGHDRFQRWAHVVHCFLARRACRTRELPPELLRASIERLERSGAVHLGPASVAEHELWTVHRIEQAQLFFEAARIALARRGTDALLDPDVPTPHVDAWRKATLDALRDALADGADAPLGLVICALWPETAWAAPESFVLAGLGLATSFEGRVLHARALVARGDGERAPRLLARLERAREPRDAGYWIAHGAWREQGGDLEHALACYLAAAEEPSARGEWARGIALGLSLVAGEAGDVARAASLGSRTRRGHGAARDDAHERVRARWPRWRALRPARSGVADRALGRLLASGDDLVRGVAREALLGGALGRARVAADGAEEGRAR